jgi:hypothetical protein
VNAASILPSDFSQRSNLSNLIISMRLFFLACSFQFVGAAILIIAGTAALLGIINNLSKVGLSGLYGIPQMIASEISMFSNVLFMLETQEIWYKPAPKVLGWWIALFAAIGSLSFEYVISPYSRGSIGAKLMVGFVAHLALHVAIPRLSIRWRCIVSGDIVASW